MTVLKQKHDNGHVLFAIGNILTVDKRKKTISRYEN